MKTRPKTSWSQAQNMRYDDHTTSFYFPNQITEKHRLTSSIPFSSRVFQGVYYKTLVSQIAIKEKKRSRAIPSNSIRKGKKWEENVQAGK